MSEAVLAVLSFACFAYVYREYRRRKAAGLLSSAFGFLALSAAFAAWFGLETANFSGTGAAVGLIYRLFLLVIVLAPFLLVDGLQRAMGGNWIRLKTAGLLGLGLVVASLVEIFTDFDDVDFSNGLLVFHQAWWSDLLISLGWLALLGVGLYAVWHHRRVSGLRSLALIVVGYLAATLAFAIIAFNVSHPAPALFLALFAMSLIVTLCLLVVAGNHPDPAVVQNPYHLIRRSLSLKTAVLQALLFWLLYLAGMVVIVVYFVQFDLASKEGLTRQTTVRLTECVHDSQERLLDQVRVFALNPRELPAEYDGSGRLPDNLSDLISISGSRLVRIVDSQGRVVYSNFGASELGQSLFGWPAVRGALSGIPSASLEEDVGYGRPVIMAAASVALDDESQGALVISRDVDECYQLADAFGGRADGYGLIDRLGDPVSAVGSSLSAEALSTISAIDEYDAAAVRRTSSGGLLAVSSVTDSAGQVSGYVYAFLSPATVRASAVGLAAVIILMAVVALVLMTLALIATLAVILKPIRELREAAAAVEKGDYSRVVEYDRPDEMGDLAGTFNQMRSKIGRQTKRLERHIQEQNDFMVNTAHEMRTPLNVFSWTVDLLRFGDTGRLNKAQLELVEQLRQTTQRLFGLVSNMSDAAKVSSGEFAVEVKPFRLVDVLEEVAGTQSVQLREKDIELDWRQPISELPPALGDAQRTYQIALNLISNAVKYTDQHGKIKLRVKAVSRRSPDGPKGRYLQVTIQDNGMGIPQDQQDQVFNRFFRARNAVSSDTQGAGLGLFLVKKLVERQGGAVWFESTEGAGSLFGFTVPAVDVRDKSSRKSESEKS